MYVFWYSSVYVMKQTDWLIVVKDIYRFQLHRQCEIEIVDFTCAAGELSYISIQVNDIIPLRCMCSRVLHPDVG